METADKLWPAVLGEIQVSVSKGNYLTWFARTSLLHRDEQRLIIGVPTVFTKKQLQTKYLKLLKQTLSKNGCHPSKLEFKVHEQNNAANSAALTADWSVRTPVSTNAHGLNAKYTFSNFVVGSSNELAYAAAEAIVKDPGNKYSPLFVYGGVGLGKTHLIQAIGNEIAAVRPDFHIEYVTCERFYKEFIASIINKRPFSNQYRNADVLIVDDIQFIAGKAKTEEEFFHTFNCLHQANRQIIISSDMPPKSIPTIAERLRNRLEWGMAADIQSPDFETRIAIIHAKIHQHQVRLTNDVVEYLATQVQSNIRELEGALTKLLAHCEMSRLNPNLEAVKELFGANTKTRGARLTDRQIVDKTARYFELDSGSLLGPGREKRLSEPRQIAMYLMRQELHLSFPAIAKAVGRKDHTTAIHSVDKIAQAMGRNEGVRQAVFAIKEKLYV